MKAEDILKLGLFVGAAYLLWQWWNTASNAVGSAVNNASASFANWYVNFATPPVTPLGNAIFANGTYVPIANLSPAPQWVGNTLQFNYMGIQYQLSPHDANGNFPATPV